MRAWIYPLFGWLVTLSLGFASPTSRPTPLPVAFATLRVAPYGLAKAHLSSVAHL